MALLAGVDARPCMLIAHLAAVSLLGVAACMRRPPARGERPWRGAWLAAVLLATAVRIIAPLIREEGVGCALQLGTLRWK